MSGADTVQIANVAKDRVNPATEEKQDDMLDALPSREARVWKELPSEDEKILFCIPDDGVFEYKGLVDKDAGVLSQTHDVAIVEFADEKRFKPKSITFSKAVSWTSICGMVLCFNGLDYTATSNETVWDGGSYGDTIATTYDGNFD